MATIWERSNKETVKSILWLLADMSYYQILPFFLGVLALKYGWWWALGLYVPMVHPLTIGDAD